MKKTIILVATILTASFLAVAYQSNRTKPNAESSIKTVSSNVDDNVTENLDENEMFYKTHGYKQIIPDGQIVKGDEIATGKIQLFVGHKLTVGNPYPKGSGLFTSTVKTEGGNMMYLYQVTDYSEKDIEIFYLFDDDIDVVRAEETSENYVDETKEKVFNYSTATNDTNYRVNPDVTAFAWRKGTDSYAVASSVATSVWALEEGEELHLIWCNKDCPIWTDYEG